MRIILSLTLFATVACATPLKGHQVNDNKLNREVAAVTDAYVGAMQARDAERVLALVADDYFEDLGNADSSDDYGRKELAKNAKTLGEDGKVAIRNIRRDAIDKIKKAEKAGLSKDESADLQDEIQKALKKFEGEIESLVTQRDKEIMTL